jgi:hypothetical protein
MISNIEKKHLNLNEEIEKTFQILIEKLKNKKNKLIEESKKIEFEKILILKKQNKVSGLLEKKFEDIENKIYNLNNNNPNISLLKKNEKKLKNILKNFEIEKQFENPLKNEEIFFKFDENKQIKDIENIWKINFKKIKTQNLKEKSISTNEIILNWEKSNDEENFKNYIIEKSNNIEFKNPEKFIIDKSKNEFIISNLEKNTDYFFRINLISDDFLSDFSEILNLKTKNIVLPIVEFKNIKDEMNENYNWFDKMVEKQVKKFLIKLISDKNEVVYEVYFIFF